MPSSKNANTKDFLRQLSADRGTLLNDDEYFRWRAQSLKELERPSKVEWVIFICGLACTVVGIVAFAFAVRAWLAGDIEVVAMRGGLGVVLLIFGLYIAIGNVLACRAKTHKSLNERLAELDELREAGLVEDHECKRIKMAIERGNC